jgi:opacity protein-like surface antigen
MHTYFLSWILAVLLVGVSGPANAEPDSAMDEMQGLRWYGSLGIGAFKTGSESDQLPNREGVFTWMGNIGYRYSKHLRFEVDFQDIEQQCDTPPTVVPFLFGSVDSTTDISSLGFAGVAKLVMPLGRFEPYVGAGVGFYYSTLTIDGTFLGIPVDYEEETDASVGHQLLAGFDIWISEKRSLGFEYRRLFLKSSFGAITNGEVDIGGSSLMGTLRFKW